MAQTIKILSWNVNGIRSLVRKEAYQTFLNDADPDILFLQETKARVSDIPDEIKEPTGYRGVWHSAQRKGYSGVAMLTRLDPIHVFEGFGQERYDVEGRVVGADFGAFLAFGVYFPNGSQGPDRLAYKLDFYRDFFEFCNSFVAEGRAVYVCGDYNTAHHSIDLARPKENEGNSGFLPVERAWMDTLIDDYRYVDTFRAFDNGADRYTWWSYRTAARKRNIGWRIDYCLASQGGMAMIRDAYILDQVQGSDHCPVGIAIEGGGSR